MTKLYLVCGPSGCGKSWVCKQLKGKFLYIEHDLIPVALFESTLIKLYNTSFDRSLIADCPFRVSVIIDSLKAKGLELKALFINEEESIVKERLIKRDGPTGINKRRLTRIASLKERSKTHADFSGTAQEVLDYLKEVK